MAVSRVDKLNSEFKKNIAYILSNKIKDLSSKAMISVMNVETTGDLKQAKVYISIFCNDENIKKETFEKIKFCRGQIRHELAVMMTIRTVPELNFILDDQLEQVKRIDDLLNTIGKGKDVK